MTKVIFRKYKDNGYILALFPYEVHNGHLITCYEHIGQHGAADYNHCINMTVPAKPHEYKNLLAELKRQGYDDLKIMKRKA